MEDFKLEEEEFIELNKLLKILSWVNSGGEAKQVIDEGQVKVNGDVETRRRRKLRKNDEVVYGNEQVKVN